MLPLGVAGLRGRITKSTRIRAPPSLAGGAITSGKMSFATGVTDIHWAPMLTMITPSIQDKIWQR